MDLQKNKTNRQKNENQMLIFYNYRIVIFSILFFSIFKDVFSQKELFNNFSFRIFEKKNRALSSLELSDSNANYTHFNKRGPLYNKKVL